TTSVGFQGTWIVTIFMSLAAAWLVAWEFDRLKPIIFSARRAPARRFSMHFIWLPAFFALGGAAVAAIWAWIGLGNFGNYYTIAGMRDGGGAVVGRAAAVLLRFIKVGELVEKPGR